MKISKQQLIDMKACEDVLERFIEQTNNTDELVDVLSLIGGKNTVYDLLWLAEETLSKEKLVRFACDLALINIEKIKPYTDQYDLIVESLTSPTADSDEVHVALRAVAADAAAIYVADAIYAIYDADAADAIYAVYAARVAADATVDSAVDAAVRAGATQSQINTLLVKMFED